MTTVLQPTSLCAEQDLAFQHLLDIGLSHWRMDMTDAAVIPAVITTINESPRS